MKKTAVVIIACACSAPTVAMAGLFGEDRSVKYTVAADYANTNVSFSETDSAALSNNDFKSDFVNVKLGLRPENFVGRGSFLTFEAHVGAGVRDGDYSGELGVPLEDANAQVSNDIETELYYGLFVVPHAVVFDMFELSFPVGYSRTEYRKDFPADSTDDGNADAVRTVDSSHNSVSFGGNIMMPLRLLMPNAPDIRLSLGGQVYHQSSELRTYGYNAGLRWDF